MNLNFVIGRFQPFHNGHVHLIQSAIDDGSLTVVFIGSVQESRTEKNPYTFEERESMIKAHFKHKVIVLPLPDYTSNDKWLSHVKVELDKIYNKVIGIVDNVEYVFVHCNKDEDTEMANNILIKDNTIFNCTNKIVEQPNTINATDIREKMFKENVSPLLIKELPESSKTLCSLLNIMSIK